MGASNRPFIGTEALAAGRVSRRALARHYRMIYRNVYLHGGAELTVTGRAAAAWLWSGRRATVAGVSAAALHGSRWLDARLPAELNRMTPSAVDGIVIRRERLEVDEVCRISGMSTTTPARTAFDLGRQTGLGTAVIRLDALANATGLRSADVAPLVDRHHGMRGLVQLRQALTLMDGGAESPQETRTRLLLVRAGLPAPTTQIVVCDDFGRIFARIDMGWPDYRVGVEFDGAQHWTDPAQRSADIDRYAELHARGWVIIRVSSELLRYRPGVVIARVCAALRAAGCPGLP